MKRYVSAAVAGVVLLALAPTASAATPSGGTARALVLAQDTTDLADEAAADDTERPKRFRVKEGVLFNHPFNDQRVIHAKMIRVINHAQKGAVIRSMSWNFQDTSIRNALIRAHKRGVAVRFIMARSLRNAGFNQLTNALKKGNKKRPQARRSWTGTCSHSCRGKGGSMHSKWITVSQSGRSHNIVMQGSANLTSSAAVNQWNDWYTVKDKKIFDAYAKVFEQSRKDRKVKPFQVRSGNTLAWFAPTGKKPDLVLKLLNQVKCKGARGAGINGRTSIRVASAVIQEERGQRIASKLNELHNKGCNIRMVYTLSSLNVLKALGNVPVRHLAYDTKPAGGDGSYDDYLHMKAMAISGHMGSNRGARVVFNGSANWSTMGKVSDEQGMVIRSQPLEKQYGKWITKLYQNAPKAASTTDEGGTDTGLETTTRSYFRSQGLKDPYAGLELELEGITAEDLAGN
ncbi:phospholipase D-like domain-containing protein [Nocardioides sp. YIM 152588]|uniref:phospholipase D-like domain-containing protein n=1 Tax=Nocardioides sp. YIM 152588 TaxID=3158259 RepID=UPI0032E4F76F